MFAERLEAETLALERRVGGRDTLMAGLVKVTCAESVASHILAPMLATLHREHPDIIVELIPDPRELSLSMREADVSVRLTQSSQHDLVIRRVGTLGFGLYASPDYLKTHDEIDFEAGCIGQHLVAQLDDIEDSEQTNWLASLAARARVSIQTSSHEAAVAATLNGGGLGCLARFRADREKGLTRLTPPAPVPATGIWMVTHKDNRRNARIRTILTRIATGIRGVADVLTPADGPSDGVTTAPLVVK